MTFVVNYTLQNSAIVQPPLDQLIDQLNGAPPFSAPLPVADGGTGATTAAGAALAIAQPGAVLQSVMGTYAANTNIATVIPPDDTIPQIGEGTEIISVSLTPLSATSKFRCRFQGWGSTSLTPGSITAAIFKDSVADALTAGVVTNSTTGYLVHIGLEVEFVPGDTAAHTVSVRVGPSSAGNMRLNGTVAGGRLYGGAAAATLVVEEVKV